MNIVEVLRTQANAQPKATAIVDTHRGRRRTISFAEIEQASARAATLLHQAGLHPGDAVLVFQPMSAELYIALSAIFRLGLVAMFLDPGRGRDHIEQCCALHEPKALIAGPKAHLLPLVSPALRRIPHKFVIAGGKLEIGGWRFFQAKIQSLFQVGVDSPATQNLKSGIEEAPALLTFTSGSTGRPKAALRTHAFLLAQHHVLAESLGLTAGQVDLATMPIVTLANLGSGVTSLIPKADLRYPGKVNPAPVVAQIQAERVTSTVASPALLERVVDYCLWHQITLPGLQKIFTGGAPVFPRLLDRLQQVALKAEVVAVYGSTEAEPMAKIARHQIQADDMEAMFTGQGLLVGPPGAAIGLKIIKNQWGTPTGPYSVAEFDSVCCAPQEAGEIVVSGDHVLTGYLYGHGDEETKFKVGDKIWHRTGDAGYLDRLGRVWLLGRCAARIEDDRGLLYPFAVECAISQHPQVHRSAVVSHQGRRILAIEPYYQTAKSDLSSLKETLTWANIDAIRVYKHIPVDKRHNAKIDYPALHKLLAN
jgi:acyl-CoA synthetase (AMP-forming)/AMP-acid ligase II